MIVVNNPGTWDAVYPPLRHAAWHGWTPTDLIFPFFLFVVGVAITLALGRRREAGQTQARLLAKVLGRSVAIFVIGLALNGFPRYDLATVRIPGVLQRIAVCYGVAALVFLATRARTQAALAAALLLGYWALLTWVTVPGFGAGDLGPEGNLAAWLDRQLLGRHIWRAGRVYDPEGVLSTLPAIATTLMGVLTGHWLRSARPDRVKTAGMLAAGVVGVALGMAWGLVFPINKSLWTSSYALFTGGMALLGLGVCHWLVDVRGWRAWTRPFVVLGANALAAFVLSTVGAIVLSMLAAPGGTHATLRGMVYGRLFASWAPATLASLLYALAYTLVWLVPLWALYRRRIILSV
jgi:predicted acyltransferase